jgi:hypothetical protein
VIHSSSQTDAKASNVSATNVSSFYVEASNACAYTCGMTPETVTALPPTTTPSPARAPGPAGASSIVRNLNWTPAIWFLLIVVCGALFLDGLDLSMIGVALPSIGRSLHLSAGSLQWIVSGYVLGYGSFLLLGGRTSDLVSRRTVFLAAVTVFGVASVISAGLSNEVALVALRFIKGASAGFTVPAGRGGQAFPLLTWCSRSATNISTAPRTLQLSWGR